MTKNKNYYKIPTKIPKELCEIIIKNFEDENLSQSTTYKISNSNEITVNLGLRNSKNLWVPTDHWVSGMMAHFIHCANISSFNYDLFHWTDCIQYTVYEGKGSHYTWHTDSAISSFDSNLIRKLSISLLLSSKDDYEGGEFQIMYGPREMHTVKLDMGDAIIFPSDAPHRVRPLKSGKRISLVGWYGGPFFK